MQTTIIDNRDEVDIHQALALVFGLPTDDMQEANAEVLAALDAPPPDLDAAIAAPLNPEEQAFWDRMLAFKAEAEAAEAEAAAAAAAARPKYNHNGRLMSEPNPPPAVREYRSRYWRFERYVRYTVRRRPWGTWKRRCAIRIALALEAELLATVPAVTAAGYRVSYDGSNDPKKPRNGWRWGSWEEHHPEEVNG